MEYLENTPKGQHHLLNNIDQVKQSWSLYFPIWISQLTTSNPARRVTMWWPSGGITSRAVEETASCLPVSGFGTHLGVQHFSLYKDIFFSSFIIEIFTKPTDFQQCGACETHCRFAGLCQLQKNILRWLSLLNFAVCILSRTASGPSALLKFYMFLSSFGL